MSNVAWAVFLLSTGRIPQWSDTDVHCAVTEKMNTALAVTENSKREQHCDSSDSDSAELTMCTLISVTVMANDSAAIVKYHLLTYLFLLCPDSFFEACGFCSFMVFSLSPLVIVIFFFEVVVSFDKLLFFWSVDFLILLLFLLSSPPPPLS